MQDHLEKAWFTHYPILSLPRGPGINYKGQQELVYSKRALQAGKEWKRIYSLLNDIQTLIWVYPWHPLLNSTQKFPKNFVWISPQNLTDNQVTQPNWLIDSPTRLISWIQSLKGTESFTIHIHPIWFNEKSIIKEALYQAASRLKTIQHFKTTWEYLAKRNEKNIEKCLSWKSVKLNKPTALILADLNASLFLENQSGRIWLADSVLLASLYYKKIPDLVFSIDSGRASYEHFIHPLVQRFLPELNVLLSPLSYPKLFTLPFKLKLITASSYPKLAKSTAKFGFIDNQEGDVAGLMKGIYREYFKEEPQIIGNSKKHFNFISHVIPSAYSLHGYRQATRTTPVEQYLFYNSLRYT